MNNQVALGFVTGNGISEMYNAKQADAVTQNGSVYTIDATLDCSDGSSHFVVLTCDEAAALLVMNDREYLCE